MPPTTLPQNNGLPTPQPGREERATEEDQADQPFWAENPLAWSIGLLCLFLILAIALWSGLNARGANSPREALQISVEAIQDQDLQRFEKVVPLEQALAFSFQAFADSMDAHQRRQADSPREELRARMGRGFMQGLEPVVVQQGQKLIRNAIRTGQVQPPQEIPGQRGSPGPPNLRLEMLDYRVQKTRMGQAEAEVRLNVQSGLRNGELVLKVALEKYRDKWRVQGLRNGYSVMETLQDIVAPQAPTASPETSRDPGP